MRACLRPLLLTSIVAVATLPAAAAAAEGPPLTVAPSSGVVLDRAAPSAAAPASIRAAKPSPVGVVRSAPPGGMVLTRLSPVLPTPGPAVQDGQPFVIRCQVNGDKQAANFGVSRLWNEIQLPTGQIVYLPGAATDLSTRMQLVAPYCGRAEATRIGGTQGRCFFSRSPVALIRAPRSRAAFIKKAAPEARRSARSTGVPASVTLAQAIVESGDGKATAGANNYFGIKAEQVDPAAGTFSWRSNAIGCVLQPTFEQEGGDNVRQIAAFRLYRTMRGSFLDHGRFLRENPRYAAAFRVRKNPRRFLKAIVRAGYATDRTYGPLTLAVMREEKLTRYDR